VDGTTDGGRGTAHDVLWLDDPAAPSPAPSLRGSVVADLAVVGGGFTGLWAALAMKERHPGARVVVLEAERVGHGASGRNGGFMVASLTHGIRNGLRHFPGEIERLVDLGRTNLAAIVAAMERYGIDAGYVPAGVIDVADAPYQVPDLEEQAALLRRYGADVVLLDQEAMQAEVHSPTYLGGVWQRDAGGTVNPARLAWGLRAAVEASGGTVYERTVVTAVEQTSGGVRIVTPDGEVRAAHAVLATNAYRSAARAVRRAVVPVYDYVLATEPLTPDQRASIGWERRQGIGDTANQFHYYRLTADDRILWGGYDAVYHWGNDIGPHRERRPATFDLLERHFRATFPQLAAVRFDHRWGGPIATTTRFTPAFGTVFGGRVAYAAGYTGLGVAASRFGATVALDLLMAPSSDLLTLRYVRSRPFPFPPEPLRWLGITLTRRALARADRRSGKRGPWLRLLDRFGVGFDS
jgi:glycine/D-amino acid oxidase-like deaminating enzyme